MNGRGPSTAALPEESDRELTVNCFGEDFQRLAAEETPSISLMPGLRGPR